MAGETALSGKYMAYPEYKDSGIDMLGTLPVSWETKQVRYLLKDGAEGIKIGPFGSALKLEDMVDNGTRVYGQENVIKKDFSLGKRRISEAKFAEMQVYQVHTNDLLVTMMGTSGKCELVPEDAEVGIIDSHLLRLRVKEAKILPRFFRLLVDECYEVENQIKISGKGSIMHGLNSSIVKSLTLPLPSPTEQEKILDFLDHETAKIDTLIDKQQQLITLLKEKRQAVISHAVTKGLNLNVPMRDSGVEWSGEVPEHWLVSSLGYYASISTGATPDRSKPQYWGGDIPWIKTGEVKYNEIIETEEHITFDGIANSAVTLSPPGTLLMAMYGQGVTRGRVALLGISATYNQACAAITPNEKIWNKYLRHFFMAAYHAIRDGGNETSQMNLNANIVSKFKITIPNMYEQHKIVEFLDKELKSFDVLIAKALGAIELMKERRTALISAAVTGKIDVRNWQAPAPSNKNKEVAV
jgi:type I restriction enzyme S subunit